MKYIISIFLAVLALCSNVYADEEKVVVNDTFENYKIGATVKEWDTPVDKDGGCYAEVVADPTNSDNKCLAMYTAEKTMSQFTRSFEPAGGITTIECRAIMSDSVNDTHYMFYPKGFIHPMIYKHGFTVTTSTDSLEIPNLVIDHNQWYDLKLVFDFYNQKVSFFVNGMEAYSKVDFIIPNQVSIEQIYFRFEHGTCYVDDLKVTTVGGISKIYTTIKSNKHHLDDGKQEFSNIKAGTLLTDFLADLEFVEDAIVTVVNPDGTEVKDVYLKSGMKIVVESPEKDQRVEYPIKLRDWIMGKSTKEFLKGAVVFYEDRPYVITKSERKLINDTGKTAKIFKQDDEVYLPLRKLCEGFGLTVGYDGILGEVYIGDNITIPINKASYLKDGKEVFTKKTTIKREGIVYIPLSWAEDITGKKTVENKNGLIILRESDFEGRRSIRRYIISELTKVMNFD